MEKQTRYRLMFTLCPKKVTTVMTAIRPAIIKYDNKHAVLDMSIRVIEWQIATIFLLMQKETFFSFIYFRLDNSQILLTCGAKYSHSKFRLLLVRNLVEEAKWKKLTHKVMKAKYIFAHLQSQLNEHWLENKTSYIAT